MSGCLDNVRCDCGIEWADKRNAVVSVVAGVLFFMGWWIIIDVAAVFPSEEEFKHACHTCGVISTLSMFMINAVSNSQVRGDAMTSGVLGPRGARLWLLLGFLLGFGSLIASVWILFQDYVVAPSAAPVNSTHVANLYAETKNVWPGVALFLQNLLIFAGSLVYKFGRTEDLWT